VCHLAEGWSQGSRLVFAKRSWTLWGIDVGHALLAQVVLAVIVTLLR
jgi:hypothetical protein